VTDSHPISAFQTLRPRMLAARGRHADAPFPLHCADAEYYYLARNGVYALACAWNLAGQEVLMPAYCHGVEVDALLHAGVELRYFPVREGMRVRPEDVMGRVTPRTRAIYLIHYTGFPGPVQELAEFCRDRNLLLIEDCALALLSKLGDRPLGSFGDAAVFCLYKTLPLPNGGVVVVNPDHPKPVPARRRPPIASTVAYTAAAMFRRAHLNGDAANGSQGGDRVIGRIRARVKPVFEKGLARVGSTVLDPANLGLGMSAICHRALASQDFAAIVERRRANYLHLRDRLCRIADIVAPQLPDGVCPQFFQIRTPKKIALQEQLLARGVESINFWFLHGRGVRPGDYPEVDHLRRTVLELPCHQDLSSASIDRIAEEVSRLRHLL
jgi:perosamine synthetase